MTTGCWALVPIKARADCKSRLAGILPVATRILLVRSLLARSLAALRGSRSIAHIAVVTSERDVLPASVRVIADLGGGLNAALQGARDILVQEGASELVVLHADLPLVTVADVDLLVERGRRTGFALATDGPGVGTNALYMASPGLFRFHFGLDSRFHHVDEAVRLGLRPEIVRSTALEFDLDGPTDLERLRAIYREPFGLHALFATSEFGEAASLGCQAV